MIDLPRHIKNISDFKIFLILFAVGFLVYSNTIFNGFIGDDFSHVKNDTQIHSTANIPRYFSSSNFDDKGAGINDYYRPLQPTIFTLIYAFSGENVVTFHLIQIAIHILTAFLVFLVFKFFFKREISFLAALIFLVHPISVEAVGYISILEGILFVFFGLLALYLTMKKDVPVYVVFLIPVLEFLSLLSKETGLAFLLLIPLFNFLFQKRRVLISVAQSFIVLTPYLILRYGVAHVQFNQIKIVPIMTLPIGQRIMTMPKVVFFYIKTFFFPKDLAIFQSWVVTRMDLADFYLPLIVDIVFFGVITFLGYWIFKKEKKLFKVFVFFSVWFIVGIGFHLQIIAIDQTVAERYFYLPIIGALGLLGITIQTFISSSRSYIKRVAPFVLILIVIILLGRTLVRNTNWKDELTLYTHDIGINKNSYQLELGLGHAFFGDGRKDEAESYYKNATDLFPSPIIWAKLGQYYNAAGKTNEAKETYKISLAHGDYFESYSSLVILMLKTGDINQADKIARRGLKKFPNYSTLLVYWAVAKYKLGDRETALAAIKKAQRIYPDETYLAILNAIENNQPINIE